MKLEEKIKPKSLEEFYELFQRGEYASFFNYEGLRIYNLISQEGEKTYLRQYELFSGRNLKNTLVEIGKYELLSTDFNKDRINLIFLKDKNKRIEIGYFMDHNNNLMILNSNQTKYLFDRCCSNVELVKLNLPEKIPLINLINGSIQYNDKVLDHQDLDDEEGILGVINN